MKKLIILALLAVTGFVADAQQGFHAGIKLISQSVWMFNKKLSDDANFVYRARMRFAVGGSFKHFANHCRTSLVQKYEGPQEWVGFRWVVEYIP